METEKKRGGARPGAGRPNRSSRVPGVTFIPSRDRKPWKVQLYGPRRFGGYFATEAEAISRVQEMQNSPANIAA